MLFDKQKEMDNSKERMHRYNCCHWCYEASFWCVWQTSTRTFAGGHKYRRAPRKPYCQNTYASRDRSVHCINFL